MMMRSISSCYITRKLERALKHSDSGGDADDGGGYITRKLERALKPTTP